MYFNYFESAFYINLDRRTDRRALFEERTAKLGFTIPRVSATELDMDDPGIPGRLKKYPRVNYKISCNISHFNLVSLAAKNKWENVLIFEDDCVFEEPFQYKIQSCVDELRTVDWDLFYMGGEPNLVCPSLTENLRTCPSNGGVYGTHAYAVNHTFYNTILKANPFQENAIDIIYIHLSPRRYVITKDLLATQDDTESDLWGGVVSRRHLYKKAYDLYIK